MQKTKAPALATPKALERFHLLMTFLPKTPS
jgi:hypothetical protein